MNTYKIRRILVRFTVISAALFSLFASGAISPLRAQEQRDVTAAQDFSLHRPRVFVGGHLGFNMPSAASDLFDSVTSRLTLEKSDFHSLSGGLDLGVPIASNYAVVVSFDYARRTANSEFRDYVEDNGNPIAQSTRLEQLPVTLTFRYYPWSTGETVGSYAWIPRRLNPYVAAGGGFMYYNFSQSGRFMDSDWNTFNTDFKSSGYAPVGHLAGGLDISLTPVIFVGGEARYSWANAELSPDFTGFDPIDLSGFRVSGGIYFRF